jgi:hypothetical protein
MNDHINQAVAAAVARDRPFAHRYEAAGRLLSRGYERRERGIVFRDGHTSNGRRCDCQEGGHIECLHKIAARLLSEGERSEEGGERRGVEGASFLVSPSSLL